MGHHVYLPSIVHSRRSFATTSDNSQDDFFKDMKIRDKLDAIVSVRSANDEPKEQPPVMLPNVNSEEQTTFLHSR